MSKSTMIAVGAVVHGKGQIANPGDTFEIEDESAHRLVAGGYAAFAAPAAPLARAPKAAGPKKEKPGNGNAPPREITDPIPPVAAGAGEDAL